MEASVQVLGTQPLLVPPQLFVTNNQFRCLINAGENTQRFGLEHGIRFNKISDVFLTRISAETFAGLPGLLLTIESSGNTSPLTTAGGASAPLFQSQWIPFTTTFANCRSFRREPTQPNASASQKRDSDDPPRIRVWGPPPLYALFSRVSADFAPLRYIELEIHEVLPTETPQESIKLPFDTPDALAVRLWCVTTKTPTPSNSKRKKLNTGQAEAQSAEVDNGALYTLIVQGRFPSIPGKLDMDSVARFKIPKGPLLGKLKAGESIVLSDGQTVTASDVCSPSTPGGYFVVIDLPHDKFLECLPKLPALVEEQSPVVVFDLTPPRYSTASCAALKRLNLSSYTVLPCCAPEFSFTYQPFVSSAAFYNVLHELLPQFCCPSIFCSESPCCKESCISALSQYTFAPVKRRGLSTAASLTARQPRYSASRLNVLASLDAEVRSCKNFFEQAFLIASQESDYLLPQVERHVSDDSSSRLSNHPQLPSNTSCLESSLLRHSSVQFLGTGAAMPSKYRNVSATLLRFRIPEVPFSLSVLFDCGEGTLTQLFRYSSSVETFKKSLLNITAVFISHRHADHHLGLPGLLAARHSLFPDAKAPLVYGPTFISSWLQFWNLNVQPCPHRFVSCDSTLSVMISEATEQAPFDVFFDATQVDHIRFFRKTDCNGCFGVAVSVQRHLPNKQSVASALRIVYSGDTRPCASLIALASDCDVLIHEATFEDASAEEAVEKCHSTISEALQIGVSSRASYVLLTHFSQRYPSIPHISETSPMAHAFAPMLDGLCIPLYVLKHAKASSCLSRGFRELQPILSQLRDAS